jgi:hypothetical protein
MFFTDTVPEIAPQILRVIESIDTNTCGGFQPLFLYESSFLYGEKGAVVEIGSYAGRSTIALAFGRKAAPGGGIVYAIDVSPHEDFSANVERAGLSNWVVLIVGRSTQIVQSWNRPVGMLFIDGDHSHLGCAKDIRCWSPHIVVGGLVVFHDYAKFGYEGVHSMVYRMMLSRPIEWRVVADRRAGSLLALERIASPSDVPKLTVRRRLGIVRDNLIFLLSEMGVRRFSSPMQGGPSRK